MIFEVLDNASAGTVNTLPIMEITEGGVEVILGSLKTPDGTVGSNATRDVTISTSAPSGGSDGDIWYTYTD